jgi:hypothetical protein
MCELIGAKRLMSIMLTFLFSTIIFADNDMIVEYTELGKFQVGYMNQYPFACVVNLPYYKPEGITQIPSRYFNALIIHKLIIDNKEIIPDKLFLVADDSRRGIHVKETSLEEEYLTLEMPWRIIQSPYDKAERVLLFRSLTGFTKKDDIPEIFRSPGKTAGEWIPEQYIIPYRSKRVYLIYSIRFFIYSSDYKNLVDIKETERMGVQWELEWLETQSE